MTNPRSETGTTTDRPACESCAWRQKAETRPRSLMAWLWRVHTRFCPGWKAYQRWLAAQQAGTSKA